MTQRELDKNIGNGKYRDYSPPSDYDIWIKRIEKYIEVFHNINHDMDKVHLDYVKKQKTNGWKLETSVLTNSYLKQNISMFIHEKQKNSYLLCIRNQLADTLAVNFFTGQHGAGIQ